MPLTNSFKATKACCHAFCFRKSQASTPWRLNMGVRHPNSLLTGIVRNMKPRAFIGSSVEGLPVAYAVQQNLLHDAEVTVWDQGVFELSATTIESLTNAVGMTDFGIFVFSPDDVTRMRGAEANSVRDNVLFELGLFIGKLGRGRVFFLIPTDSPPHIPSDLLGIAPAKYQTNRADGSMQAATGAACHQMRLQISKLGPLNPPQVAPDPPSESGKDVPVRRDWLFDFFDEKYTDAKATLQSQIQDKKGDEALEAQAWIRYCDWKLEEKTGLQDLLKFAAENDQSAVALSLVALILRTEREVDRAIALLESAHPELRLNPRVKIALSECYIADQEPDKAISVLEGELAETDPGAAIALADILETQGKRPEALRVIHAAYMKNPRSTDIRYKYARLADEQGQHSVAMYFLDGLAAEKPNSVEYWGYLGNACLALRLHDRALRAYRKAEAQLKPGDGDDWILSNIGNLFNNKGLANEAIPYLERALQIDAQSEYAHDRMSGAIKKRDEEYAEYKKRLVEGQAAIKEVEVNRRSSTQPNETPPPNTDA